MLHRLWEPIQTEDVFIRGGWRQRAAAAEQRSADTIVGISQLASRQLLQWADGELSASRLQEVMADAVADGMQHPMVVRMSGVMASQHAHQGFMDLLRANTAVLDDIRPISGAAGGAASHILPPSSIIRCLYQHYPDEFTDRFGADPRRVAAFWENMYNRRNSRHLAEYSILRTFSKDDLRYVIPLTIHEDAGPITKLRSAVMISFASLLGLGNEKVTHFLCATYIKRGQVDNTPMWNDLMTDFEAMSTGLVSGSPVAPVKEADGVNWKFLLLFAKGGEEVRCNEWGLMHYSGATEICSECLANRTNRPWTDMRRGASWRGTEDMSLVQYRERMRKPLHPLATSKFMWRVFFYLDVMHIFDCKGMASTVFGSVAAMLVRDARLGPNQQARLNLVNTKLRAWYADRPGTHRLPTITLANLVGSSSWSELSGPGIKAASTRASAPFWAALAQEFFDGAGECHVVVRKVTLRLAEFYNLLASAPMFMDDATLQRLGEVVVDFGIAVQYLRSWAETNQLLFWQVRPKLHKAMHMPFEASVINPRTVSCYSDESQVGTSARVWKGSVKGKYKDHVQRAVLAKRWLAVLIRYERGKLLGS
jgi:hypothetical protein